MPALAPGKAPNINEIARNLRVANENPSKQATVLLRSGQEEATVDAVLRVVDEKPIKHSITVDNTGSPQTGRLRVGLGYQNANIERPRRSLHLPVRHRSLHRHTVERRPREPAISPLPNRKVTILGAGYRIPLYAAGDSVDFTVGYSNVNSGTVPDIFNITGAGTILGARYTRNLTTSVTTNTAWHVLGSTGAATTTKASRRSAIHARS